MKTNITISRPFHDHLLDIDKSELCRMYDLHKVTWSLAGPTFHDVGAWYRNWIQAEHLTYVKQRERPHLVVQYKQ